MVESSKPLPSRPSVRSRIQRRHISFEEPKTFAIPLPNDLQTFYYIPRVKKSNAGHPHVKLCVHRRMMSSNGQVLARTVTRICTTSRLWSRGSPSYGRSSTARTKVCRSKDFQTRHDHRTAVVLPARLRGKIQIFSVTFNHLNRWLSCQSRPLRFDRKTCRATHVYLEQIAQKRSMPNGLPLG